MNSRIWRSSVLGGWGVCLRLEDYMGILFSLCVGMEGCGAPTLNGEQRGLQAVRCYPDPGTPTEQLSGLRSEGPWCGF